MRFDKAKDPVAVAARTDTRYCVTGFGVVELNGRRFLASTDGHALLLIVGECDGDDALVPGRAYPACGAALVR